MHQNFLLETCLASGHSQKIQTAIVNQYGELEGVIPLLVNVSDDEISRLRFLVRSIAFITIGVTFMSTVIGDMESVNFNQFAEPFRRAVLKDHVPTWDALSQQIRELVNASAN
jgi:hypothetical protein